MSDGARRDQMSLFVAGSTPPPRPELAEVLDALQAIELDDTTPREALAQIAEWQRVLKSKDS